MLFIKITEDIETAKQAIPNLEGVCFVDHRDTAKVEIVCGLQYQELIETKLTVENIEPFTYRIRENLIELNNVVFAGDISLIE